MIFKTYGASTLSGAFFFWKMQWNLELELESQSKHFLNVVDVYL